MCSVVGCDSWRRASQRFKLPEDPEKRLEWVQFLFEVNGQRLKESSWTDITICSEHFTYGCFDKLTLETGTVQLKFSAVPSLCIKSEPDEPETHQEPVVKTEAASQCDELISHDSPSSYSEESGLTSRPAPQSPMPGDNSDAFMSDYSQMLEKIANLDIIREKAALLQKKGTYVVNENRLLQLFTCKCPSCGSKVRLEKFTYGVLLILTQQCLECEYRNQWKSQVNASVPEDQHLTGGIDVTPQTQQTVSTDDNQSTTTGVSETAAVTDEESDPMDDTEESGDEDDMDSDEDWSVESDAEIEHSELCTECGMFFKKRKPHTCEHKIKPYSCYICGKRFATKAYLNCHSRIHDENYEHRCKYCSVTFKTKLDKHTHEETHLNQVKPYKCSDCSETFATHKQRRIHLKGHRGPRQLKCHICGIEFNLPKSLKRHLAVHTGEKPYKCSVCQRGFNQPGHLKSHIRLHTGERPYKCQHCDKCFNHNVSLKSHIQRYHSSHSGHEQKKGENKTVSDTVDDQETDDVEEEHDEEEGVQKERTDMPKSKTGRPIGRPKRNAAGGLVGKVSNTKTAKVKVRKLKRTLSSDEESENEPTESDMSFDSAEEGEERSEKVTSNTSRSRGRAKYSDSDFDFDPDDLKKKRYSSQDSGKSSGKHRGRPRKNQVVEDT